VILVNGVLQNVVPADDRGLAYGDGVFRTLAVTNERPAQWARHYAKLAGDCSRLGIPVPDEPTLAAEIESIARSEPNCVIKIIITRGHAARGYRPPRMPESTRIVLSFPLPHYPQEYLDRGVRIHLCRLRLAFQPALAGVKHLNRLENVLARAEWSETDHAEGMLLDAENNVVCGTMSNVFVVESGALATPDLTRCGVAGITRDRVIAAAGRHGMACRVQTLPLERVLAGDELFVVNSLIGVWPVQRLARRVWRPGEITSRVRKWLNEAEALS
jgi:4-amino-4-deoxychorismate lyase